MKSMNKRFYLLGDIPIRKGWRNILTKSIFVLFLLFNIQSSFGLNFGSGSISNLSINTSNGTVEFDMPVF